MSISPHTGDREHDKFRTTAAGPAVAIVNADGTPVSAGGGGGTSMVDDSAFTPAASSVTPIGAFADETAADSVDEGDVGAVRMTLQRALHVNLRDASGAELSVGGGTQYAEDTASADGQQLTMAGVTRADSAASQVGADGDRSTLIVDANGRLHVNGSGVTQPVSDAGGSLTVDDGGGSLTVDGPLTDAQLRASAVPVSDGGGSLTVDGSVSLAAAIPAGTNNIGDVDVLTLPGVAGDVAHDAADSGNPLKVGGVARTAEATGVTNGDRVNATFDPYGKQVVLPYAIPENFTQGVTAAMTGTSDTTVIAAPGAGVRLYVTSILVTNSHATVSTLVELKDGAAGTVIWRGFALANGGGFSCTFPTPLRLTANTALVVANVTTGSNTYCSATAYKAP